MTIRRIMAFVAITAIWFAGVRGLWIAVIPVPNQRIVVMRTDAIGVAAGLDGKSAWVSVTWWTTE